MRTDTDSQGLLVRGQLVGPTLPSLIPPQTLRAIHLTGSYSAPNPPRRPRSGWKIITSSQRDSNDQGPSLDSPHFTPTRSTTRYVPGDTEELIRCRTNLIRLQNHYATKSLEEVHDICMTLFELIVRLDYTIKNNEKSESWDDEPRKLLRLCESLRCTENFPRAQTAIADSYRAILNWGKGSSSVSLWKILSLTKEEWATEYETAKIESLEAEKRWRNCKGDQTFKDGLEEDLDDCEAYEHLAIDLSKSASRALDSLRRARK